MKDAGSLLDEADALVQQNRVSEAKQLYLEVTRLEPGNPDAWFMLGLVEQEQSNAALAEAHLRRAIELDERFPEAHLNLANLLRTQARIDEAKNHARQAAQLSDDYIEAWLLLGAMELEGRDYASAQTSFKQALRYGPDNPGLHANLGHCQAALGELADAKVSFSRAIALGASSTDEYLALARVELQLRQFAEAVRSASAAREKSPARSDVQHVLANAMIAGGRAEDALPILDQLARGPSSNADVWFALGNAHHALDDIEKARACYEKVCLARPDSALFQTCLGNTEFQLGYYERAIELSRRALALQPGYEEAILLLAEALRRMGAFSEAIGLYYDLLQAQPGNCQALAGLMEIYEKTGDKEASRKVLEGISAGRLVDSPEMGLAAARVYGSLGRRDEAMQLLAAVLTSIDVEKTVVGVNTHVGIHNQLGKLLDREGRYSEAFSHFSSANSLRRSSFEADVHVQEIDRIIANWQARDLARAPVSSLDLPSQPLFIVGMPRSGSTLAEQILSSHPLVWAGGEIPVLPQLAERMCGENRGAPFSSPQCSRLTKQQIDAAVDVYRKNLKDSGGGARYFTDKNLYNYLHLGLISLLFPNARFIHCKRSPLDTCLSIYAQNYAGPTGYATSLDAIGNVYVQYLRLMEHWRHTIQNPIFELSYEALVENQELTTRSLLEFCELPWDERCLAFQDNQRTALTASYNQVRQPMYRHSIGRWKNYEAHLAALIAVVGKS